MANIYDDVVEVARRTMVLFFIVDTSGSMEGTKIGTLNQAIEDVIPEIREISENNADAEIKIAVIEFSTGAKWITPYPIPAEDFEWQYLNAGGYTDFGEACQQLDEKLSRNSFMSDFISTSSFAEGHIGSRER